MINYGYLQKKLFSVIKYGNNDECIKLLNEGANANDFLHLKEGTALTFAASLGRLEICKIFLNYGAKMEKQDYYGNNALHNAANKGHINICEMFLNNGIDVNIKTKFKSTPLICSITGSYCENKYYELVKLFIDNNAYINDADEGYNTALHWATIKGKIEICKLLIDNGADVNNKNIYDEKPIDCTVNKEIIKLLKDKEIEIENLVHLFKRVPSNYVYSDDSGEESEESEDNTDDTK